MVVKTTDSAADAEQTALSGASRRPPNAQACPAWRRKRAKPPSPCPQTVGRSPPSVLRAQKATDGKRKGKWQQASCTSLPTTTSTRTWLAVGTTKDRGQRGGGKLRQYGQGGYIHRLRQPKATHAKNKTTHGTRVQNEPTISIARPHASVTSFPGMRRDFAPHILSGFSVVTTCHTPYPGTGATVSSTARRANRGYELAQGGHVVRKSRTCATKENLRRVCLGNQVDPAPSQCLCPGNPSPGHTKRQITMIAGASRGEWLRGPMHFGFGVLGHRQKGAPAISIMAGPLSWPIRRLHIFARGRTPRTAGGLTPP